jgi:three-Cys-motif partner protein
MNQQSGRSWGYWTRAKLAILDEYLDQFVVASSGQSERVYLDAFAGEGEGLDRLTGEEFKGSARIALEANEPGFTRFRFFEMGTRASELEAKLRADYPGRDIVVYEGDCNETIPAALRELEPIKWAPCFAFLDPDGMELAWSTIRALADHTRGYRSAESKKPEFKVELWMLFPSGGLVRTLALDVAKISEGDAKRATNLFGDEGWWAIYERRQAEWFSGAEALDEYVNLMRWRLERELGYRWTHPLELRNTAGAILYHMIFATDNDAGTQIMEHLYGRAAAEIPEMRREAADRRKGQGVLELGGALAPSPGYHYEPPWEPPPQVSALEDFR